jgi:uncharacterized FlaG/YvyC family protein
MNVEKVKLIIKNMELLIRSLKEEIEFDVDKYIDNYKIDDYDEIFED